VVDVDLDFDVLGKGSPQTDAIDSEEGVLGGSHVLVKVIMGSIFAVY
jgi:hypothetical protein